MRTEPVKQVADKVDDHWELASAELPSNDEVVFRAFRWSVAVLGTIAILAVLAYLVFAPVPADRANLSLRAPHRPLPNPQLASDQIPTLTFTDVAVEAGIDFRHFSGGVGKLLMPKTLGSGCAFLDYDNDGRQDILLLNGTAFPGEPMPDPPPTMALFHNDGQGRFSNVTANSGLDVSIYGVGVAVGDYDGDGLSDLFISALGSNRLFRNLGDGRFEDVTAAAGVAGEPERWSTSAGFVDYDNDNDLDLFVCNYVDWSMEKDLSLDHRMHGVLNYVQPAQFGGTHCYLYRNRGDRAFEDVSADAGIQVTSAVGMGPRGKALGVVIWDLDEDGWQDLVVANDGVPAFLFHNQRDGTFRERGEAAGIGHDHTGAKVDGMGIDMGHLYEDDRMTIGIANTDGKTTALFTSQQDPFRYVDNVLASGIATTTQRYTSWGLFFFDCDLDGRLDLFQCTGSVNSEAVSTLNSVDYLQPPLLFWNCGPGRPLRLSPVPPGKRSSALAEKRMSRGAAYGDIDGDGDLDVLVSQIDRPAMLLRNDQQLGHRWIRLKLHGEGGNREALGARIEVHVNGQVLRRRVQPTRSYCSQVELPVTIGLGSRSRIDELRIIWPDGEVQTVPDVEFNRLTEIHKSPRGG